MSSITDSRLSRRKFIVGASAGAAGLALFPSLLSACGSSSDKSSGGGGSKTLPVKLLDVPPGTSGGLLRPLIEAKGYLKGSPLKVSWVGAQPSETQTSLLSGALDIGTFGPIGAVIANNQGHDIRLIGPALNCHVKWIVKGDSDIKSLKDLVGKRIGTLQETTATYQTTMMTAILAGIDFKKDFKVTTAAPPALLALFKRGDVAAIATTEPTATLLVADGARQIASVNDLWKKYSGTSGNLPLANYAVKQSWATKNPDTHKAVVDLFYKVNKYIQDDPNHIVEFADAIGVPPTNKKAIELIPERMATIWTAEWDDTTFAALKKQNELAVKVGILPKMPSQPVWLPRSS